MAEEIKKGDSGIVFEGQEDHGEVIEIWESYSGDLWILTEIHGTGEVGFGYARLSQMPQFAEWGHIERGELVANSQVWEVQRGQWMNVNTYDGVSLVEKE